MSSIPFPETAEAAKAPEASAAPAAVFPIVGIGASAGGLKALSSLLAALPASTGMAFVVIQHLDATHDSVLSALLARSTRMPVAEAVDGVRVLPDRVYVITPNTGLVIADGVLRTMPRATGHAPHLPIDGFLRALAADRGGRAVGVILSGTGSDGTLGVAAIKQAHGTTFAQDDSAGHPGMPLSAIGQGHVDFVLAPAAIAGELARLAREGFPRAADGGTARALDDDADVEADSAEVDGTATAADHGELLRLLQASTGVDFTDYRATTITRRTRRRMALAGHTVLADYLAQAAADPGEMAALARDILIHVTGFFRDQAAFDALRSVAFPALTAGRAAGTPLRLWVVGCSTGQEVYSLAIELLEHLRGAPPVRVQIFATDISDWALGKARLGWYPATIADSVPAERLARYFTADSNGFRIAKAVRDLCVFARHDVASDAPFSQLDLISCRNVLIYLGPPLQKQVLPILHFALRAGGFLLLGASETIWPAAGLYAAADERNRLYRALPTRRFTTPLPVPAQRLQPPPPAASAPPALSEMQRAADQVVLGRFAPPGVLISANGEIIQFRGHTNLYLQPAAGQASTDLLTMVTFAVATALREALAEAARLDLPVRREHLPHQRGEVSSEITIEVIPVKLPATTTCFLVLFEGEGAPGQSGAPQPRATPSVDAAPVAGSAAPATGGQSLDQREVAQLRDELAAATDHLRALVEQNQAQAAQLREAHGEEQSRAEEFHSISEEMQSAKEEVEASNEELVTINEEMRSVNDDRARVSAELRVAAELTAAILETMRYPLLVLAHDLRVERANQAFCDTFQVGRDETVGRLVYDLGDRQWDIAELRRLLEDILPGDSTFKDFEVTHDFARIGRRTMLLNARRIAGTDASIRLIVLVIADITERARHAQELKEVSDELQRSNTELEQFAAIASHDLQEPLRTLTVFTSLLQHRYEPLFDEAARGYMDHITGSARRMSDMITAILSYSRLGHEVPGTEVIDSAGALHDALRNLGGPIIEAGAAITEGPLPQVRANREQLIRLFQNLLGNAVKYRSEERPLRLAIAAREAPGEWVFSIADNGIGMDAADHERIFQLFQRVHSGRFVRGTGIGLASCKKIVEHHRGRIWVESQPEVGSTFYFSLPR